jgi:cytochrome c oxidase subunit 3
MSMPSTTTSPDPGQQYLQHHFDDLEQQHLSSNLGMWFFLASEVMFFSGILAAYMVYRLWSPDAFHLASRHMDKWIGLSNTGVLLTSSLTMALAVRCTQVGDRRGIVRNLVLTAVLATVFLGVKALEYRTEINHNLFPGKNFIIPGSPQDPHAASGHGDQAAEHGAEGESGHEGSDYELLRQASMVDGKVDEAVFSRNQGHFQLMFVFYFFITGIHAFHMLVGIVLIAIFAVLAKMRWFSGYGQTQIEMLGLYWHFVDLVWVFVYPLLYLVE